MNCKSRTLVIWPIMLVPKVKPIISYLHSWYTWSEERHILKCKEMVTRDLPLEQHWIHIVLQTILENFCERDTILHISDLHNSFYNNLNAQSKPHMKHTWIQKHQIRKLNSWTKVCLVTWVRRCLGAPPMPHGLPCLPPQLGSQLFCLEASPSLGCFLSLQAEVQPEVWKNLYSHRQPSIIRIKSQ